MKIRIRRKRPRPQPEPGLYDPDVAPKPDIWLALSEADRLDSIIEYHDAARVRVPSVRAHAAIHVVVENQLAEGLPPVVETYERLLREGLGRHAAVHAIGVAVSDQILRTAKKPAGPASWTCPRCGRGFRQVNQRHACGVGSTATLLKGRPPALADLYHKLEATVRAFGGVEVVTRDRYALFRTTRIFADLTVTRDALRVVVHLGRKVSAPCFSKVGPSGKRVSHVGLVRTADDLRTFLPFFREAFDLAVDEQS